MDLYKDFDRNNWISLSTTYWGVSELPVHAGITLSQMYNCLLGFQRILGVEKELQYTDSSVSTYFVRYWNVNLVPDAWKQPKGPTGRWVAIRWHDYPWTSKKTRNFLSVQAVLKTLKIRMRKTPIESGRISSCNPRSTGGVTLARGSARYKVPVSSITGQKTTWSTEYLPVENPAVLKMKKTNQRSNVV